MDKLRIYRFWPDPTIIGRFGDVLAEKQWAQISGNYSDEEKKTLIEAVDKKSYDDLKLSLETAANRLEGIALAFEAHGTNLNADFFITHCKKFAQEARDSIKK